MILQKAVSSLGRRKKILWKAFRVFLPRRIRFFYEGHPRLEGQLWYRDRKLIYQAVRKNRPIHCFEVGTWKGGGSTLFIAWALSENGNGILHTIEINPEFHAEAKRNYRTLLPGLIPHVDFRLGDYREVFPEILKPGGRVDFLILDGPEDGQATLDQFHFFLPFMRSGAFLIMHDWMTEKARLVRPFLENSDEWRLEKVLLPPRSIGMALAVKIR
jgi:predicted O-methyltransferase YrrM